MTLDLAVVSRQVQSMTGDLAAQAQRMRAVPAFAGAVLRAWHVRPEEASAYLAGVESGGVWPFAVPEEPLLTVHTSPGTPRDYAILASDGSQIDVDSHGLVHCLLINVGWAALRYGPGAEAWLSSSPQVLHQDDEIHAAGEDGLYRPVEQHTLAMVRTVAEIERLAVLAEQWREAPAPLAVADGTLVRWEFGGRRLDAARGALLRRYTTALARFRELGVPLCSYISRPNAREVANAVCLLALQSCSEDMRACAHCAGRHEPLCALVRQVPDRQVLAHLPVGARSALFRAHAPVLDHYAPPDRISFFYLRLHDETVRVELPRWACAPEHLERIQAIMLDQCARGRGYPVALMEAHEQAVIHGSAREAFRLLVMEALHLHELEASVSAKRLSKDQRAV